MSILSRLLSRLYARWRPQAGPAVAGVPKPVRHYDRGTCPACGRTGLALRQDGQPHKRHHCAADYVVPYDPVPEVDPRRNPMTGCVGEVTPGIQG